jgi:hypothetical protein
LRGVRPQFFQVVQDRAPPVAAGPIGVGDRAVGSGEFADVVGGNDAGDIRCLVREVRQVAECPFAVAQLQQPREFKASVT